MSQFIISFLRCEDSWGVGAEFDEKTGKWFVIFGVLALHTSDEPFKLSTEPIFCSRKCALAWGEKLKQLIKDLPEKTK